MKRIGLLLLSAATVFGCQRDDSPLRKELADVKSTMASNHKEVMASLKSGAAPGANRPQRPQRPRPKPEAVYSVNIKGAPFIGAKDAKVTIVEAFEFA